jgi:hypothetical protein
MYICVCIDINFVKRTKIKSSIYLHLLSKKIFLKLNKLFLFSSSCLKFFTDFNLKVKIKVLMFL